MFIRNVIASLAALLLILALLALGFVSNDYLRSTIRAEALKANDEWHAQRAAATVNNTSVKVYRFAAPSDSYYDGYEDSYYYDSDKPQPSDKQEQLHPDEPTVELVPNGKRKPTDLTK